MSPLKNRPTEGQSQLIPPQADNELAHLKALTFSFDMDNEQHNQNEKPEKPQQPQSRSRSTSAPTGTQSDDSNRSDARENTLLAQLVGAVNTQQPQHGGHLHPFHPSPDSYPLLHPFLNDLLSRAHLPLLQLPPFSSLLFPWAEELPHPHPPLQSLPPHSSQDPYATYSSASPYSYIPQPYAIMVPPIASGSNLAQQNSPLQVRSSISTSSGVSPEATETDPSEAERSASADDKRRRNTAASARFRVKKKQRTINLERFVSDLAGRAEELEREAADLRRENGWLKEIVVLKSSQLGAGALNLLAGTVGSSTSSAASVSVSASGSTSAASSSIVMGSSQESLAALGSSETPSAASPNNTIGNEDEEEEHSEVEVRKSKGKGKAR